MKTLIEVAKELIGMFVADARLTVAVLTLVTCSASLVIGLRIDPLWCGALLLLGSLAILAEAVLRGARGRWRP
ncbi:hypothetical protein ACN6KF_005695 [Labrys sp. La1]|uniref:hypothetical protein n=1 Tax=Labrys sp. La1 TaxID=3404917 RepID=UPI003EC14926